MRLFFVLCTLLFLLFKPLCAEKNNNNELKWYLKNSLAYENSVMLNSPILEIQTIIELPFFTGDIGASINDFSQDISANIRFFPYKNQYLNVGFAPFSHASFFTDIGQEINIGSLAFIEVANKNKANAFRFLFEIGSFYKFTFINILPKYLVDITLLFSITFAQRFLDNHEIAAFISSYEDYYYPLFANPSFHLKYTYTIHDTHSIGGEAFIRYTDMFTLTNTIDGFQVKAFYILKLPV